MGTAKSLKTTDIFRSLFLVISIVVSGFAQSTTQLGRAPGKMIDVGDHKLHINCIGPSEMKLTVVFEAGGGAFSKDWSAVQTLLGKQFKTCAYDRAGLGWSDPGPVPRTLKQEVFELHTLLHSAEISVPLVLVGQSLGALNVRLYTSEYGNEVAGIVLVDPAAENSLLFNMNAKRWMKLREQARGRTVPSARISGPISTGYKPEDDYLGDEAQLLYIEREKTPQPFGDRPLFVLAAGKRPPPPGMTEDEYKEIRRAIDQDRVEAAHLSHNSKFVLDTNSGHDIQIDDPEAVVEAVEQVVTAVKNHTKLNP
jgi:pimeloyl-ACP methyl ester carboxylesterase